MSAATQSISNALSSSTRKFGKTLVTSLFVSTKVSKLYGYEHQNFQTAIDDLLDVLNFFLRNEGNATLNVVNEFLVLNEVTLKIDLGGYQSYRHVVDLCRERELGTITFNDGIDRDEVVRFVHLLNDSRVDPDARWESFQRQSEEVDLPNILLSKIEIATESDLTVDPDARAAAIGAYYHTIAATQEAHDALRSGESWNPKRLKRCAQTIVDLVMSEESTILAMTSVRQGETDVICHATNTTILSAALGAKIGLEKRLLGDLAFAALMHDIGKLDEGGEFDPTRFGEAHTVEGARRLLLSGRVSSAVVRAMNVAFLHHRNYDGTGFPQTEATIEPSLLTRIVAVANTYDGLTAGPPRAERPLLPAEALARVTEMAG
ncbi:MAG: HD domain-containing protein, partial [Planctomycetes bacterium]|nr:HD domain-containing protein [Planctomycetota bacterium]